ncbi:MAG: TraR/DksA C4-type zinc finger protein [Patescibacteria group bacterium]
MANEKQTVKYPANVLGPVKNFLQSRLGGLEKRKKEIVSEDPYVDKVRRTENAAIDAEAAEKVGHMQVFAIRKSLDRSIIQIRKALARIKFGKYGVCESCGKMIDTDRLMVMPETTVCINCEKRREK